MTMRRIVRIAAGLFVAGLALGAVGAERPPLEELGLVFDETPGHPGTLEGVGRPVASGDLVKTLGEGALVRFDNGQVLKLSPNSSAVLEIGQAGEVTVTVLSGRVATVDGAGRPLVAGQRSKFELSPAEGDAEVAEARLLRLDLSHPERREAEGESRRLAPGGR
jgi:hypothetical protein